MCNLPIREGGNGASAIQQAGEPAREDRRQEGGGGRLPASAGGDDQEGIDRALEDSGSYRNKTPWVKNMPGGGLILEKSRSLSV